MTWMPLSKSDRCAMRLARNRATPMHSLSPDWPSKMSHPVDRPSRTPLRIGMHLMRPNLMMLGLKTTSAKKLS
jgi:hypothetical protein